VGAVLEWLLARSGLHFSERSIYPKLIRPGNLPGLIIDQTLILRLKFLVEIAHRARDVNSAGNTALTILYALDDARCFAAFGTVGRLRRVHYLLAITCFCNLCHLSGVSPSGIVSAHIRLADGFNVAAVGSPLIAKKSPDYPGNEFA
jgi:hypothetical protein